MLENGPSIAHELLFYCYYCIRREGEMIGEEKIGREEEKSGGGESLMLLLYEQT